MSRYRNVSAAVLPVALLAVVLVAGPTRAQEPGIAADVVVTSSQGTNTMHVTVDEGRARMDLKSPRGEVSMIYGPDSTLMIMHDRRMYMEFTPEMMQQMQKMMGAMGRKVQDKAEQFDPSQLTFERTGRTETIGGFDTFEVKMTNSETGDVVHLWMSEAADVGLFDLFARMAEPLGKMSLPGMQGGGPVQRMRQYLQYSRANGLPQGRVLRLVGKDGGGMSLGEVTRGPFDASVWKAPAGYKKQQMPMMRQR